MVRVLVTGMSGAGKSTVLAELAHRGHATLDTDHDGWTLPDGRWDEPRTTRLLAERADLVICGTVENQGRFYDRFEHVVLLSAPLAILLQRVRERTTNPYGTSPEHQDEIALYTRTVEPLLRRGASLELDARRPVVELADTLERLVTGAPPSPPPGVTTRGPVGIDQVRGIRPHPTPGGWAEDSRTRR